MKKENTRKFRNAIKFLNDYFVKEIMNQEYEILNLNTYTVSIKTLSGKSFNFWISNTAKDFKCYEGYFCFLDLEFTEEQKMILHTLFRNLWNNEQARPEEIKKRKELFLKLKPEFENASE